MEKDPATGQGRLQRYLFVLVMIAVCEVHFLQWQPHLFKGSRVQTLGIYPELAGATDRLNFLQSRLEQGHSQSGLRNLGFLFGTTRQPPFIILS